MLRLCFPFGICWRISSAVAQPVGFYIRAGSDNLLLSACFWRLWSNLLLSPTQNKRVVTMDRWWLTLVGGSYSWVHSTTRAAILFPRWRWWIQRAVWDGGGDGVDDSNSRNSIGSARTEFLLMRLVNEQRRMTSCIAQLLLHYRYRRWKRKKNDDIWGSVVNYQ